MKLTNRVKPISYLKANAPAVLEDIAESRSPMVITVNGEAKAVLQDIASYEETQDTLALLQILSIGEADIRGGKALPLREAFVAVRRNARRRR
ncbi:MAG: type II toxin-antitoxin system Phd/YefM family antitoxin [Rhizomicrobium sp.]